MPIPTVDAGLDCAVAPRGLVAALGRNETPLEVDRLAAAFPDLAQVPRSITSFRFGFHEVPFQGRLERRGNRPVLTLIGDLGLLPFTIENARRRRRMLHIASTGPHATGMRWEITPQHEIRVQGEIELSVPLTVHAVIAGVASLLLRVSPYLDLFVEVAGEADPAPSLAPAAS